MSPVLPKGASNLGKHGLWPISLVGLIGLATGIVLGLFVSQRKHRGEVLAFMALGLLTGGLIGLSTSPIVGAAVAAGFSLAGTVLSNFGNKVAEPQVRQTQVWLAPFAVMAVVGILAGITIRANDLLNFNNPDLRTRYIELGFASAQIDRIMDRLAGTITAVETVTQTNSNLFRKEIKLNWGDVERLNFDDRQLVEYLFIGGSEAVRAEIRRLQGEGKTDKEVIAWIRKQTEPSEAAKPQP